MRQRLLVSVTLLSASLVLSAADAPAPLPTIPAQPRPLQLEQRAPAVVKPHETNAPSEGSLIDDIGALRRAVERVQESLAESTDAAKRPRPADIHAHEATSATNDAERRFSTRFGAERLSVVVPPGGEPLVSAAISREAAEVVYRELALLLNRSIDDTSVVT